MNDLQIGLTDTTTQTEVLIIGAGPTGLALACQFVRYGVDFVIIEKNQGVTPYSKALGVHARTLEIYEQLGLAQSAVAQGAIAAKVHLLKGGEVRAKLDLSNLGKGLSPYPYVLFLEQSKNEQLLYDFLRRNGKTVRWQTELEHFSQTEDKVTAQVKRADGASQRIEATYLVGCDGPKSPVRHALGLEFSGSTFERVFYVADAQIAWNLDRDGMYACLSKESFLVFFPLKGENRYRIVGTFPEEFSKDDGDVLYAEIEQRIQEQAELKLDIHTVEWFSTYKVHTRHVSRFSTGRCFLAGDAAHIHSPAGAQGMNTGIQDGYNLAWKLALVLKGRANKAILDTYNEERLENAKHLLQTTDRLFQLAAGDQWLFAFLRTQVLPHVANFILSLEPVKKFLFPRLSQISINYRYSSLSQHAGDEGLKVKAGDRMPYFLMEGKSIYDKLHQPKFHLLLFSNTPNDFQSLNTELDSQTLEFIDFNIIPLYPQVSAAFGMNHTFNVLLRPDNYIAFISAEVSLNRAKNYLKNLTK
ncbi:FAD-dependent monooxygenase [Altericista sp. CCNU0014]|uniref:FAD-dependent monooxygenase n=1 Tax=Altericista sp. CCNU0014 TaxID=3082949 RepID=UPI00384F27B4